MSAKPYHLIFALLLCSVLCILVLQGFWIRNFYVQKKDEFGKTTYAALEQVAAQLRERQNLRAASDRIVVNREVKPKTGRHIISTTTSYAQLHAANKGQPGISIVELSNIKNGLKGISITDSVVKVRSGNITVVTKSRSAAVSEHNQEVDALVDKMLSELRVMDAGERNADTLRHLIRRVFQNKGFFLPFEFALEKIDSAKTEVLARSPGFDDQARFFMTDLSMGHVFSNHQYLLVQFPGENDFVFAAMKNTLLLSLVFSLLIIGVFYYTIRLILRQKKLSEVKADFVNNLTHELKTPIATISLAVDSIGNPQVKNNEALFKNYTRILKEENKKLNDHVERVLQLALLDKGGLKLYKKPVNLVSLIEAAIQGFQLQIEEQKADVRFVPPASELVVKADAFHLQTVFSNLLDNALKYARGEARVTVTLHQLPGEVQVKFRDNGIGIDAQLQEKVFERFYRVQGGDLHDVKGFGLGLSYARSVVEAHGGRLVLHSQKGKGSEFIIQLKTDVPA